MQDYENTYAKMTDEELMSLALELDSLTESARIALRIELRKRRLGEDEIRAYQQELEGAERPPEDDKQEPLGELGAHSWSVLGQFGREAIEQAIKARTPETEITGELVTEEVNEDEGLDVPESVSKELTQHNTDLAFHAGYPAGCLVARLVLGEFSNVVWLCLGIGWFLSPLTLLVVGPWLERRGASHTVVLVVVVEFLVGILVASLCFLFIQRKMNP